MLAQQNLLDFDLDGLVAYLLSLDEKPYRARQLLHWIHQRGADRFEQMTDLARTLRDRLGQVATLASPAVLADTRAGDGTRKWLLDVGRGNAVEAVYIPEAERGTLCVSSQAGCAVNCRFCATGKQGFNRNLTTAEIIGQLWWAEFALRRERDAASEAELIERRDDKETGQALGARPVLEASPRQNASQAQRPDRMISNVVLMGMGEPLQNYSALLPALRLMLADDAYGLSRRRVTVSTAGMVPQIDRLGADCPVALAVSLHAPNDALRDDLVPLNRKYPLRELLAACHRYLRVAPRDFITFEYVMLDDINDRMRDAHELVALLRDIPCKVNLIPFNPFPQSDLHRSTPERIRDFARTLHNAGIVTTTRKTRGDDIAAACGQLAGEVLDRTRLAERSVATSGTTNRRLLPPIVAAA